MRNLYKTLKASPSSNSEEIQRNFRRLAMKFHPDRNQGTDKAKVIFQKLNDAYEIVGDAENRRLYDFHGAEYFDLNENDFSIPEIENADIGLKVTRLFLHSPDEHEADLPEHTRISGFEERQSLNVEMVARMIQIGVEQESFSLFQIESPIGEYNDIFGGLLLSVHIYRRETGMSFSIQVWSNRDDYTPEIERKVRSVHQMLVEQGWNLNPKGGHLGRDEVEKSVDSTWALKNGPEFVFSAIEIASETCFEYLSEMDLHLYAFYEEEENLVDYLTKGWLNKFVLLNLAGACLNVALSAFFDYELYSMNIVWWQLLLSCCNWGRLVVLDWRGFEFFKIIEFFLLTGAFYSLFYIWPLDSFG